MQSLTDVPLENHVFCVILSFLFLFLYCLYRAEQCYVCNCFGWKMENLNTLRKTSSQKDVFILCAYFVQPKIPNPNMSNFYNRMKERMRMAFSLNKLLEHHYTCKTFVFLSGSENNYTNTVVVCLWCMPAGERSSVNVVAT